MPSFLAKALWLPSIEAAFSIVKFNGIVTPKKVVTPRKSGTISQSQKLVTHYVLGVSVLSHGATHASLSNFLR